MTTTTTPATSQEFGLAIGGTGTGIMAAPRNIKELMGKAGRLSGLYRHYSVQTVCTASSPAAAFNSKAARKPYICSVFGITGACGNRTRICALQRHRPPIERRPRAKTHSSGSPKTGQAELRSVRIWSSGNLAIW